MISNVPIILFWFVFVLIVAASYWWNPKREKFNGSVRRYGAACVVHALFNWGVVISFAVFSIENRGGPEKNHIIWGLVAMVAAAVLLRELAKKFPVIGPLLVDFDNG
jgi:hypothetical protein